MTFLPPTPVLFLYVLPIPGEDQFPGHDFVPVFLLYTVLVFMLLLVFLDVVLLQYYQHLNRMRRMITNAALLGAVALMLPYFTTGNTIDVSIDVLTAARSFVASTAVALASCSVIAVPWIFLLQALICFGVLRRAPPGVADRILNRALTKLCYFAFGVLLWIVSVAVEIPYSVCGGDEDHVMALRLLALFSALLLMIWLPVLMVEIELQLTRSIHLSLITTVAFIGIGFVMSRIFGYLAGDVSTYDVGLWSQISQFNSILVDRGLILVGAVSESLKITYYTSKFDISNLDLACLFRFFATMVAIMVPTSWLLKRQAMALYLYDGRARIDPMIASEPEII